MPAEVKKEASTSVPRRDFLTRLLLMWGSLVSLPFVYAIAKFVYPPITHEQPVNSISVGSIDGIQPNSAKIVKFNRKPVIVVRTPHNQFKAFRANCTHLGCIVEYRREDEMFHCNCHGSVFDVNGKNVKGPAQIPLEVLRVSIKDTDIILSQSAG